MKRLLRIFALLMTASMLVWLAGCGGDDDDDDDAVPPVVVSITSGGAALAGASIPANASILVTFDVVVTAANITVDVPGTTAVSGKTATWTPTGNMAEGSHTLSAISANGMDVTVTATTFTAVAPDTEAPTLAGSSCDPKDGATGVDPADYGESIKIVFADNVGVASAKVTAVEPKFDYTPEYDAATKTLLLKFMKYTMPNETEFTITIDISDGSNPATVEYSFTTMSKEE